MTTALARLGAPPPIPSVPAGIAAGLLASMPVAMVLANRSAPLILVLAALAALVHHLKAGHGRYLRMQLSDWRWGLASAGAAILVLVVTGHPPMVAEAVVTLLAVLVVGWLALPILPRWTILALAGSFALACLLILTELETDLVLRRLAGLRFNSFIFNRPAVTLAILFWPMATLLTRHWGRAGLWASLALGLLMVVTVLRSDSGASGFALLAAGLGFIVARFARPLALAGLVLGLVASFALAPVMGEIAARALPPAVHTELAQSNSRARVEIWQSFGAAVRAQPWLGQGFGTSARFASLPVAKEVEPEYRTLLGAGHPHNMPLQVWAETGLAGVLVALGLLLWGVVRPLSRLEARRLAPRFAAFAAILAVALVGHGAWQGWWLALLGATIIWFRWDMSAAPGAGRRRPLTGELLQ
jgi:O-antigen ligase